MSKDKGSQAASKSRSNNRGKSDRRRKRERLQTPSASYSARARAVSTTKYSESDSEERRSHTRSRSPMKGTSRHKHTANTKRVVCQQEKGQREWPGIKPADAYALAKAEHKRENAKLRHSIKKIHCNIFKGRHAAVPPIMCLAHKSRKSTKGCDVTVTPDTGATMTMIPWSLGKRLKLDFNTEDNNYTLVTASGDSMTVLGTTVAYLHPDKSDTRPVYGIITDDLGESEILLSYSDMRDWGCCKVTSRR